MNPKFKLNQTVYRKQNKSRFFSIIEIYDYKGKKSPMYLLNGESEYVNESQLVALLKKGDKVVFKKSSLPKKSKLLNLEFEIESSSTGIVNGRIEIFYKLKDFYSNISIPSSHLELVSVSSSLRIGKHVSLKNEGLIYSIVGYKIDLLGICYWIQDKSKSIKLVRESEISLIFDQ